MAKEKARSKTYYKMLSLYLAVFLTVFSLFSFITMSHEITMNKNEELQNQEYLFDTINYRIGETFSLISKIDSTLYMDRNFGNFALRDSVDRAVTVINELNKLTYYNPLIDEIFFYPGSGEFLYSSKSSFTKDLLGKCYQYKNWSLIESLSESQEYSSVTIRPMESVYNATTNMYSDLLTFVLSGRGNWSNCVTIIMVNQSSIEKQLSAMEGRKAVTVIMNEDDSIIYSSAPDRNVLSDDIAVHMEKTLRNQDIKLESGKYHVSQSRDNSLNLRVITYIDQKDLFHSINKINLFYFSTLFMVLLLGIWCTVLVTKKNYKRVHKISQSLKKNDNSEIYDEFDFIYSEIENMKTQYQSISSEYYSSEQAIKNYLIYSLVKSRISTVEEFNKKGSYLNIKLLYDSFCIIKFSKLNGDCVDEVENFFPIEDKIQLLCREELDTDSIVAVCCYDSTIGDDIYVLIEKLQAYLSHKYNQLIKLAVSNSTSNLLDLNVEYINVTLAKEYFSISLNPIVYYSKIEIDKHADLDFYVEQREQFSKYLQDADLESIKHILEDAKQHIIEHYLPIVYIKTVCYSFINEVLVFMTKNNSVQKHDIVDTVMRIDFIDIDDIFLQIEKVCELVCSFNEPDKDKTQIKEDQITAIKEFISENYLNPDFSVQIIALEFDMKVSTLSIYFKKNTGVTLIDYITRKKMEYVKQRIDSCDMLIKDIAQEAGYYNITSFNRRFKQVCGVTPSEYKSMKKE